MHAQASPPEDQSSFRLAGEADQTLSAEDVGSYNEIRRLKMGLGLACLALMGVSAWIVLPHASHDSTGMPFLNPSLAFVPFRPSQPEAPRFERIQPPEMGMFDGLAGAFANEEGLSKQSAGLTNGPKYTKISWKSPSGNVKVQQAIAGQKLRDLAKQAGIKISYSCTKGECHTCDVTIGGRKTPACQAICPTKDCTIQYYPK